MCSETNWALIAVFSPLILAMAGLAVVLLVGLWREMWRSTKGRP